MIHNFSLSVHLPLRVGIVGTGYAAKFRAETLQSDPRCHLVAVCGHTLANTTEFSQKYQAEVMLSWHKLVKRQDLDLIIICTINRDHGAIARAALDEGKHVVVEYPLSLDVAEAEELINLAKIKGKLLHVEHIELLGGLHQALKQSLALIGTPFYARYSTIVPELPAPQKWTYQPDLFGFPLIGALSRLHRFTDLFGTVKSVSCQAQFWGEAQFYKACICNANLKFTSGLIAEVIYGKGEHLWQRSRLFEIHGETGALIFDGDEGKLVKADETIPIEVASRRGLFAKDTGMVLDCLTEDKQLYVSLDASLYALKVGEAARQSAETGQTMLIANC